MIYPLIHSILWKPAIIAVLAASMLVVAKEQPSRVPSGSNSRDQNKISTGKPKKEKQHLREGSNLEDVSGRFEITGDRITFYRADGGESYRVLENLALERIAQVLSDTREKRPWIVKGTITEFQGANFLLVNHAVVKPRTRIQTNRR